MQKKLVEVMEENASLEFEQSQLKEGCVGSKLRRMISYPSSEFLGSQLQLAGVVVLQIQYIWIMQIKTPINRF